MIQSDDVRRVRFERSMRGYRQEDVEDYLRQVADSMDAMAAENEDLQKKLRVLAQRIDQYRADEDNLRAAILDAQRLGKNVVNEAKAKAAEIIRAANIKADDAVQRARDDVALAEQEAISIRRETDDFKKNLMAMYRKHIQLLSKIPEYNGESVAPQEVVSPVEMREEAPMQQPAIYEMPAAPIPTVTPAIPVVPATPVGPEVPTQPYYEEPAEPVEISQPVVEAPPAQKVDTVEFAIAPKAEEQDLMTEADSEMPQPFAPGAGLYGDAPEEPVPEKKPSRSKSKGKSSRKKEAAPSAGEVAAAFGSFADVDFDS